MKPKTEQGMTVSEAAQALGVTPAKVRDLARQGLLGLVPRPSRPVPRRQYVTPSSRITRASIERVASILTGNQTNQSKEF